MAPLLKICSSKLWLCLRSLALVPRRRPGAAFARTPRWWSVLPPLRPVFVDSHRICFPYLQICFLSISPTPSPRWNRTVGVVSWVLIELGFGGIHALILSILLFIIHVFLSRLLCFVILGLLVAVYDCVLVKFVFLLRWSMMYSNLCIWRQHFDDAVVLFLINDSICKLVDDWQGFFSWTLYFILSECRWIPLWAVTWCVGKLLPWQ